MIQIEHLSVAYRKNTGLGKIFFPHHPGSNHPEISWAHGAGKST